MGLPSTYMKPGTDEDPRVTQASTTASERIKLSHKSTLLKKKQQNFPNHKKKKKKKEEKHNVILTLHMIISEKKPKSVRSFMKEKKVIFLAGIELLTY